jgi:hypothetical protein
VTRIVRIIYLGKLGISDATYTSGVVGVWASLESAAGILSVCIPSMAPLVMKILGRRRPTSVPLAPSTYISRKRRGATGTIPKSDFARIDEEVGQLKSSMEFNPLAVVEHDDRVRPTEAADGRNEGRGGKPRTEILITREILQTNETDRDDSSCEEKDQSHTRYPWEGHPQPASSSEGR